MNGSSTPRPVFITGALGFVGRRLADRYRAAGSEVAGVDMRPEPELGVVAGDLANPGDWQDAAAGAELVIHTAARLAMDPEPMRDPSMAPRPVAPSEYGRLDP